MPSRFVHLHVHSHYSLLEALSKTKEILGHVQKLEMDAVALTDNGAMYGAIEFYQKAKEMGVKPILGLDIYMAKHGRLQKRPRIDTKPNKLVLLAETMEGYHNLLTLSSIGFLEGFYYKPRIDKEVLALHTKGLIALSGGHFGEINECLHSGRDDDARRIAAEYRDLFGEQQFFLELVDRPELAEQETVNAKLIAIGKELSIPVVATKDTYYTKPDQIEAWKILQCIKGGKTLEQLERVQQAEYDASIVSGAYMEERFKDLPEAIENTRRIADRCQVELDLGKWNFAKFDIPEGKSFRDVLTERAFSGLEQLEGALTDEMRTRLEYEIQVIDQKGFCPYFLIVSDFLSWAKTQGIVTTTRGSAAGSLTGYALRISGFNPLTYQLPFERFLNPERPSAPDIDADFADNRRDDVLNYVRHKYGEDQVAQICTFGKMLARGSVRDVGRALGFAYGVVDEIAKLVPMGSQGFPMTLTRALEETPDLREKYDSDADCRRIIDLAKRIEGCARHVSVHAAGTVISPSALTDFTPLQIDTKEGKMITQYEMKSVESAGLVKMDFLGIRNLSILGDAVQLLKKTKQVELDIERVPLDDLKTYQLLSDGHTMGVFQLSGDGMTKYLVELKPSRVEDIMAMVALYRPGPIDSIPEYIRRKHNPSLVRYLDPRLESILQKSHGVLVYQDDVMLIAIHLGGYSWLEADKLRKAMGKKIPEEMAQQKIKLMEGLIKHGMSQQVADELWALIEPFAAYGFNKAHAASYGMVAYQTAYMKANYPAEYMASLMTAEVNDLDKIAEAVHECKRIGIEVLPPDINESYGSFTFINDRTIRFGLVAVKGLGTDVVEAMIAERKTNGPFQTITDFASRVHHRAFNKKSLECLIKAGALDRFGERGALLESMERILVFNKEYQKAKDHQQGSLFEIPGAQVVTEISLKTVAPLEERQKLNFEYELLGLYLSGHPYRKAGERLGGWLLPCGSVAVEPDGSLVRAGGLVTACKTILTKKSETMAFVTLEDVRGKTEVIVFPKVYTQVKAWLIPGALVLVSAKASRREGEETSKLLANSFILVDEDLEGLAQMLERGMWVEGVADRAPSQPQRDVPLTIRLYGRPAAETMSALRTLFEAVPGRSRVCFEVESTAGTFRLVETDFWVSATPELKAQIVDLLGERALHHE